MSGIAGVLVFDPALDGAALVRQITAKMRHRGPDGVAHWSSGPAALGHCMLRTTPEAATEAQPLVDAARGIALAWDGRLDNRDELYGILQPSFPRQGVPDSAYVLEAYARWGEDCLLHLLGDFAFALWDAGCRRLFCARDPMGGAPFVYVLHERYFALASDAEALLRLPGVSAAPNEDCIAHLLAPEFINRDDRRTWQRDVLALLAGESMTVEAEGRSQIRRYRIPEPTRPQDYGSVAECQEHFLEVFGEAVRCRMRSAHGLAVMMSGGLDTAGVVAMMRRLMPRVRQLGFNSYSAIDDDLQSSPESQAILSMAALPGVAGRFVSVPSFSGALSAADLVETAWSRTHPVDNSILLPALMCLSASRCGERVMLHGASGDVTLRAPLRYVSHYLRRGQLFEAWRECQAAGRNHVYLRGVSPVKNFALNVYSAFVPSALKPPVRRMRQLRHKPRLQSSTINPAFAERLRLLQRIEEQRDQDAKAPATAVDSRQIDIIGKSVMSALTASGRVGSRYGIETRDPWADRRVVEFFLGLPVNFKVRDGWTKYLVRSTFQPDLEPAVLWRTDKEHLGWKLTARVMAESHELLDRLMQDELASIAEYVDTGAARELYATYRESGDAAACDALFTLATLMLWLNRVNRL